MRSKPFTLGTSFLKSSSFRSLCLALAAACFSFVDCHAAPPGFELGPVSIESVGPMAFAPKNVLLIGDPKSASLYAIDTEDAKKDGQGQIEINDFSSVVSEKLGLQDELTLGELVVNPETGNVFVTVQEGSTIHLVKVDSQGDVSKVNLDKVLHATKKMPNPPVDQETVRRGRKRNPRMQSITDLAFFDGKVMVTGVSADDSPSRVLEMPYPFFDNTVTTSVEIFHAAHGRVEDSPIQTFVPMVINGEPNLLAGFVCTPLVRFPVSQLGGTEKVRGTTVAELGNRNKPLDMIFYEKDGETSVLMSNTARGTMKISTQGIGERESLREKVSGGGSAGQPYETIDALKNVVQMDKLDDQHAIALVSRDDKLSLETVPLP